MPFMTLGTEIFHPIEVYVVDNLKLFTGRNKHSLRETPQRASWFVFVYVSTITTSLVVYGNSIFVHFSPSVLFS